MLCPNVAGAPRRWTSHGEGWGAFAVSEEKLSSQLLSAALLVASGRIFEPDNEAVSAYLNPNALSAL
jgi:hypothetical protein